MGPTQRELTGCVLLNSKKLLVEVSADFFQIIFLNFEFSFKVLNFLFQGSSFHLLELKLVYVVGLSLSPKSHVLLQTGNVSFFHFLVLVDDGII